MRAGLYQRGRLDERKDERGYGCRAHHWLRSSADLTTFMPLPAGRCRVRGTDPRVWMPIKPPLVQAGATRCR